MKIVTYLAAATLAATAIACPSSAIDEKAGGYAIDADGTVHLPAFEVPLSTYLSPEAKEHVKRAQMMESRMKKCTGGSDDIAIVRTCFDQQIEPSLKRHRVLYPVNIEPKVIAGVYTEVFTPKDGVADKNKKRVLINLHAGGFTVGARTVGQAESIPISHVGKIKVVSVDYRQGPENVYPAASEDVAKVYQALLEDYKPENIGIYGCSAGGVLTAQSVVWFQKHGLPRPGAVGMFCNAAKLNFSSDSRTFFFAMTGRSGTPRPELTNLPYFKSGNLSDPAFIPMNSEEALAQFPPSLLITSTRDQALSSVAHTHGRLVKLGVEARLHVWEGLEHAFFIDPGMPESREVYDVVTRFFDQHLGKKP